MVYNRPVYLTSQEVADRYRVSVSAVMKQRAEGRAPGSLGKRIGKRLLWSPQDLDAFDGGEQGETFGALHALVLEVRGVNKRLDELIKVTIADPHPPGIDPSFYRGDGPPQIPQIGDEDE